MGLKIAVVGTSNSILKGGYTYGIKDHPGISQLDNWSLGASTTVVLPKVAQERTFDTYDYVIFDFAVNEEQLLVTGATSIADIRDRLAQFISMKVNSPMTTPVIALLPLDWGQDVAKPVSSFYEDFAKRRGYPFFNGYDFIAEIHKRLGRSCPLFQDAAHLRREVAYGLGRLIADALTRTKKSGLLYQTQSEVVTTYYHRKFSPIRDKINAQSVVRKSSISESAFYVVTPYKGVNVSLEEEVRLCGLELNCAETNSNALVNNGYAQFIATTNTRHYTGDGRLIHAVIPVKPITGREFTLTAECGQNAAPVLEVAGIVISGRRQNILSPVWELDVQPAQAETFEETMASVIGQIAAPEMSPPLPTKVQFDEAAYLQRYPDVARAVALKRYESGRHHFEMHGRSEGRNPYPNGQ